VEKAACTDILIFEHFHQLWCLWCYAEFKLFLLLLILCHLRDLRETGQQWGDILVETGLMFFGMPQLIISPWHIPLCAVIAAKVSAER
jgi:hypothetical protein